MDFNYNDDNATGSAVDTNGDGGGGEDYMLSPTSTDNGRPAPLETEHQLTNLSMPKKKSSILGASSNLVNSIVGEY